MRDCVLSGWVLLAVMGVGGCPSKHTSKAAPDASDAAVVKVAPSPVKVPLATITGTVSLAAKQRLPAYTAAQFLGKQDGQDAELPKGCTPIRAADLSPVTQVERGGLTPILITVTGFKKAPAASAQTRSMVVDDCRIQPTLLAAVRGDTMAFTNRSPHAFLPKFRGDAFLQAVIKDQTRHVKLSSIGVQRIGCAFGAACGSAHLVVLGHPVFAITDAQGKFRIANVPANQALTVHAWHPLFRETRLPLELEEHQERHVELTISPAKSHLNQRPARSTPAKKPNEML